MSHRPWGLVLCVTYLDVIGYNVGTCMCNTEIGQHFKEISSNITVILTDEWMDVLKGRN